MENFLARLKDKNTLILLAAAVLIIAYIIYKFHINKHLQTAENFIEVKIIKVVTKDVPIEIKEAGNILPYQTVAVKSRVDSQMMQVFFKDGEKVEKGETLFKLDDLALKAQEAQLEANLVASQVQLEYKKAQYERSLKLYSSGFETRQNFDSSKSAYDAQIATVEAAKAAVENVNALLAYTVINAPITGRAGTINFTIGNNIKANDTQPLVIINQIDPIKAKFSLAQKYFDLVQAAIAKGKVEVRAKKPESGASIAGYLEYIENTLDQNNSFGAHAVFANSEELLWPGMYVDLTVNLGYEKNAVVVPAAAVQNGQDDTKYVYVYEAGKAKKYQVVVTRFIDDTAVIGNGLDSNQYVIIDGILGITDGCDVKAVTEGKE